MLNHKKLLELRKQLNLTQEQVAKSTDISTRNYQRYEACDFDVKSSTLVKLSKFFDISADELLIK